MATTHGPSISTGSPKRWTASATIHTDEASSSTAHARLARTSARCQP